MSLSPGTPGVRLPLHVGLANDTSYALMLGAEEYLVFI